MALQISKWGNSLAIRLPATLLKQVGWRAGDKIDISVTRSGEIVLKLAQSPASVWAGLGMLAGCRRDPATPSDPEAKLLQAIRDDDQKTHS